MNNLSRSLILALAVVSAQPLLAKPQKWVGTWASSPLLDAHAKPAEEVLTGTTLREVVHVSIGGEMVRVRFSNLYGTTPLMIGAAEIALMKQGALLVNAARGPVVQTAALLEALQSGRIRAALDVTDPEPLPKDHPLWSAPNLLITPHIAGSSPMSMDRAVSFAAEQVGRYLRGEELQNIVTGHY